MICPFCREREFAELFEIYDDGSFQIATCCESTHESITLELAEADPDDRRDLLRDLGVEGLTGKGLRRVIDADMHWWLDYKLEIRPIRRDDAKAFVRAHHRHASRPPAGWRFGASIWNGFRMIGVVMVGRPVARRIDHRAVVEVNRLCLRPDVPAGMAWNACSQLYGWAAREAKRRGFRRIITYTLQSEPGTSLRAAGWTLEGEAGGGSWSVPSRPRDYRGPTGIKHRWARDLA